jgi:surfeit locus 1 family protein
MASNAPAAAETARPRRPAWIPTVAAFVTIALCMLAGSWQQRRMHEKEALQAQIAAAADAPPVALPERVADWRAWRFRSVVLTGRFDARHQILIDNKVHAGRVGFAVVTPFVLDDGRVVLVDRGFVAVGSSRAVLPAAPPPHDTITLRGRIDIPTAGYMELGGGSSAPGPLWQQLDPQRFAQATGIAVLPIVVEALEMPVDDGLIHDFPLPDAGIGKHLSYMVQWYTFAAMALGLWLWLTAWPRLRRARRR